VSVGKARAFDVGDSVSKTALGVMTCVMAILRFRDNKACVSSGHETFVLSLGPALEGLALR
jgi:hypothetical protein